MIKIQTIAKQACQVALVVKNSPANAGDTDSSPGSGRSPGYSCLENSMDGGSWQALVHGVAKSCLQPVLKQSIVHYRFPNSAFCHICTTSLSTQFPKCLLRKKAGSTTVEQKLCLAVGAQPLLHNHSMCSHHLVDLGRMEDSRLLIFTSH